MRSSFRVVVDLARGLALVALLPLLAACGGAEGGDGDAAAAAAAHAPESGSAAGSGSESSSGSASESGSAPQSERTYAASGGDPQASWPEGDWIFISVDTLRADHLPFYGYARPTGGDAGRLGSPAWLAEHGVVHESVWAPIGKTLPSLASFWTGLFPLEHGAISNPTPLKAATYAQQFARRGFRTGAAVANRLLAPGSGLARGFDHYAVLPKEHEPRIPADLLTFADEPIAAGEPLMLWAHFMAPHQPYTPPEELADRFTDRPDTPADNDALYGHHARPSALDEATREALIGLYDAEILATSQRIQELLVGLDARYRAAGRGGLLDAAHVVFFSDHGEELAERHGYFMHAKSLYRGVLHVPLVIAGRGRAAGRDATRMPLRSVLPLLLEGKPAAAEFVHASWQTEFYAVRDGRWSLVHNPGGNPMGPLEPPQHVPYPYPTVALYDRDADPLELRDVAAEHPEQVRRLLGALRAWFDGLTLREAEFLPGQDPQAFRRQLVALGYAEEVPDSFVPPWPASRWKAE